MKFWSNRVCPFFTFLKIKEIYFEVLMVKFGHTLKIISISITTITKILL